MYLNIPVSEVKQCLQSIVSICIPYVNMFINVLEKGLEKNVQKMA